MKDELKAVALNISLRQGVESQKGSTCTSGVHQHALGAWPVSGSVECQEEHLRPLIRCVHCVAHSRQTHQSLASSSLRCHSPGADRDVVPSRPGPVSRRKSHRRPVTKSYQANGTYRARIKSVLIHSIND